MLARPGVSALGHQRTTYDRTVVSHSCQTLKFPAARRPVLRREPSISQGPARRRLIVMSFLREALKGAKADVESAGDEWVPRLVRATRVAGILGVELAAIVALAPYGVYAMSVYRRLTSLPMERPKPPAPATATTATAVGPALVNKTAEASPVQPQQQQQQETALTAILHKLPLGRYGVAVHREVSYGPALRNKLDVYVPLPFFRPPPAPSTEQKQQQQQQQQQQQPQQQEGPHGEPLLPVVFFVHGGVWASGETWQYAPMASRLAQAGLVVVVPTYTLYPEALAGTMVEEISAALSWTFDNVALYGGDPARVTATGHSAGGHLVAWALLRRAAASASADATPSTSGGTPGAATPVAEAAAASLHDSGDGVHTHGQHRNVPHENEHYVRHDLDEQPQGSAAHSGDRRDTAAYLLGAGGASLPGALHALRNVADVQLHPQPGVDMSYDDGSTAAAAGAAAAAPTYAEADARMPTLFVGMSAVYDIAKHYEFEKSRAVHELSMMKRVMGGPAGFAAASPSVILSRAADAAAAVAAPPSPLPQTSSWAASAADGHHTPYFTSFELLGDAIPARAGLNGLDGSGGAAAATPERGPTFSVAAAARLPPFVLMSSCSDHMVPWHEGAELVLQLRRCGVPVRHLLYNHVGHGDFVMAWRPLKPAAMPTAGGGPDADLHLEGLLPCGRDFLRIVTGRVQPVATGAAIALSSSSSSSSCSNKGPAPLEAVRSKL
ncbi:hypothetical protein Vretimale_9012 [Volvox reticuliferus]|uniref:protein-S-isoprenylcysteine alpha-carbonyl methylesterase n=1 Tax=Volvox reticuliferus TaxID=1737510 RepID=A0A8J4GCM4_9CHLO|nr:hypothetical protein Vretifemale_14472 [Volvox reticuliferus]GIM04431.1 hypothetical protein Vretimale_9012 [Volvox reticuliferus]